MQSKISNVESSKYLSNNGETLLNLAVKDIRVLIADFNLYIMKDVDIIEIA